MAEFLPPAADKKDCGEVKNLVSHFQSVEVICLSAVKTCGLEILSGAADMDSYMRQTQKTPHVSLSSHDKKNLVLKYKFFRFVQHAFP